MLRKDQTKRANYYLIKKQKWASSEQNEYNCKPIHANEIKEH